jgi:nucleoside-diphosphate-sugar epimerase
MAVGSIVFAEEPVGGKICIVDRIVSDLGHGGFMRILILGGTGAMGVHIVQLLAENGIETVVTSRSGRSSEGNVSYIQGDAHDMGFLEGVLQKHWDAIIDFMVYSTPDFRNRIDLLLGATSQYVFLSSARVYASSDCPMIETSPRLLEISQDEAFLATDEYALAKARQEDLLKGSGKKNWTIIRPYITYSESRLQLGVLEKEEWLYRALQGRTIVFSREISSKVTTMTYGLDVAKGIMAVVGNSSALGQTFHITGENATTWTDILTIYLDALEKYLGRRPKVLLQDLDTFMEWKPAKDQIKYDRLFNRRFDNTKIAKYIDISSFTQIGVGLESCLMKLIRDGTFSGINWKIEALKDRQTEERASLREIPTFKQKVGYLCYRYFPKILGN